MSPSFSSVTHIADSCTFTVAVSDSATGGTYTFVVPYISSSGASRQGVISVEVSNIVFTAPTMFIIRHGRSRTLNILDYAQDGNFDITCSDAVNISSQISSVTRNPTTPCLLNIAVRGGSRSGSATFEVPLRSSGGDTFNAEITIIISHFRLTGAPGAGGILVPRLSLIHI